MRWSEALRELFGNPQGDFGAEPPWPLEHPAAYSLIWIAAIIAICAPLAIRAYQRTVAR